MDVAIAIGFATTGATLLVTVLLFVVDRALTRREARANARHDLVVRVMDTFDLSARAIVRPAFMRAWVNSDLEFALLALRVLVDLPSNDRIIAVWLQRQVQHMQLATTIGERIQVRTGVGEAMLRWQHREIDAAWFKDQLQSDPVVSEMRIPFPSRLRQFVSETWAWTKLLVPIITFVVVLKQAAGIAQDLGRPQASER